MKKLLAALFAAVSGFYLVALAWIPDPLPFLDEALALTVFVKSMGALGLHLPAWVPLLGRKLKPAVAKSRVIDV